MRLYTYYDMFHKFQRWCQGDVNCHVWTWKSGGSGYKRCWRYTIHEVGVAPTGANGDYRYFYGGRYCGDDCYEQGHWGGSSKQLGSDHADHFAEHCANRCRITDHCKGWTFEPCDPPGPCT